MKLKSFIVTAALLVSGSVFSATVSTVSLPNVTVSPNSVQTLDLSKYLTPTFQYAIGCTVQDMTNPKSQQTTFDLLSDVHGDGPSLEFLFNGSSTPYNQFTLDPTKNPNTIIASNVNSNMTLMAFGNSDRTDTILFSNCVATPIPSSKK